MYIYICYLFIYLSILNPFHGLFTDFTDPNSMNVLITSLLGTSQLQPTQGCTKTGQPQFRPPNGKMDPKKGNPKPFLLGISPPKSLNPKPPQRACVVVFFRKRGGSLHGGTV